MQAQAPYAPYFGLWSRLRKFGTADLTDALTKRRLVRVALMRSTVHLVTTADYRSLRPWAQPALDRELDTAFKRILTRPVPAADRHRARRDRDRRRPAAGVRRARRRPRPPRRHGPVRRLRGQGDRRGNRSAVIEPCSCAPSTDARS
ncbi:DNA glycosylase AlkZ-like family protein [Micromonospora sp. KLBMP9576]|uniref:DNA glycosylase AlkZ-like family protein n=1 Tax=Micromonospora sp. KLBMP9576 TaxID=3424769 RepID=UPI003D8C3525